MRAEQMTGPVAEHGEGPVWDARTDELVSVDMHRGDLLHVGRDGAVRRRHVADLVAALRPRTAGGWVLGVRRGFALLDDGPDAVAGPPGELWDDPDVRMNDGGCDPAGAFWCGSMGDPGRAALHRLDADGTVTTPLTGLTTSNGLCWTADGARAHYVDSATGRVDVLRTEDGHVVERRAFAEVDGTPDGLTVDAEGGVWVAVFGGGAVLRFAPDGRLDALVELPASHPTSCAFGGPGLDELWITTSTQETGRDGRSGALYRCLPGVRGVAPFPYRG